MLIVLTASYIAFADTTSVDSNLLFKANLPQSWILFDISDSSAMIVSLDTKYKANLYITRYKLNDTLAQNPRDWTENYFIAYKLFVENSSEPYGDLLWYDSTTSAAVQSVDPSDSEWAPWLFAQFESIDTSGIVVWGEYERFTAHGKFGYEMYAMSDTADMKTNYSQYASILQSIKLLNSGSSVRYKPSKHLLSTAAVRTNTNSQYWYTISGRRIIQNGHAIPGSGFYCKQNVKTTLLR